MEGEMMGMMMRGGGQTMMGPGMMGSSAGLGWVYWGLWLLTWILVIIALIAFIRWMWRKGDILS